MTRRFITYFILFLGIFLLFFWLSNFEKFADPDSFYHVKITELLMGGNLSALLTAGILKTFPFLPLTTLSNAFSDQHFLYHAVLLPFFAVFSNHLFAIKIAANFFAAAVFALFYWLLGKLNIKGRLIYIVALLSSCTFIFRMNSPKAGVLSVILMLLLFWLIIRGKNILGEIGVAHESVRKYSRVGAHFHSRVGAHFRALFPSMNAHFRALFPIFICSFLWVFTHGSWPLAILMVLCFVLAQVIVSSSNSKIPPNPPLLKGEIKGDFPPPFEKGEERRGILRKFLIGENIKIFFAVCGGAVSGLIFNPFFPQNILFNWVQVFQIGAFNYSYKIGVGSEWYPPNLQEMLLQTGLLLPLFVFAFLIFIFAVFTKKRDLILNKEDFLPLFFGGIFSAVLFLLALKSRRNMEYFVPITVLFSALLTNFSFNAIDKELIKNKIKKIYPPTNSDIKIFEKDGSKSESLINGIKKAFSRIGGGVYRKIFFAATIFFVSCASFIFYSNIKMARSNFENGFSWDKFKNASEYIKNNPLPPSPYSDASVGTGATPTPSLPLSEGEVPRSFSTTGIPAESLGSKGGGEIIFHSDWDDFPMLFYWNSKNYYISGLDPTFLYLKNRDLYEKYVKITSGEQKTDLAEIIKNDFKSRYVLIGKDHPKMADNFSKDNDFKLVYEDEDAWIYKTKN